LIWFFLPPEILFGDEVRCSSVVDAFDDVIVGAGALHSAPEVELLKLILVTELEDAGLQRNDLFSGEGLPYAIDELKLGRNALNLHVISYIKLSHFI
jgi:hypothetical protein